MRIAQILLPGASAYERKSQRIDLEALRNGHEVVFVAARELRAQPFDVAHVYGPPDAQRSDFVGLQVPYVAPSRPRPHWLAFRRASEPARIVTPLRDTENALVPEAVEDSYFGARREPAGRPIVGSFARPEVASLVEQTMARIHRFRDDVDWTIFDAPPTPDEIASMSAWVDPAITEADFDGFVAEAIAAGVTVVAARTPINAQRLEKGRTGFLVPPGDPNELTHAILATLFRPEAARQRESAARQTASKFRVRHRLRALLALYESLDG
jgi:glycosyltransferase involved in cell wall biosynthesis